MTAAKRCASRIAIAPRKCAHIFAQSRRCTPVGLNSAQTATLTTTTVVRATMCDPPMLLLLLLPLKMRAPRGVASRGGCALCARTQIIHTTKRQACVLADRLGRAPPRKRVLFLYYTYTFTTVAPQLPHHNTFGGAPVELDGKYRSEKNNESDDTYLL